MTHGHDFSLVLLSAIVGLPGSFVGLSLASRLEPSAGVGHAMWLAGAAVAISAVGTWSMHFVGILAFKLGSHSVGYDIPLTLLFLVGAIFSTGLGLAIVAPRNGRSRPRLISGTTMGFGIGLIHFTGMAAMRTEPRLSSLCSDRPSRFLTLSNRATPHRRSSAALWSLQA